MPPILTRDQWQKQKDAYEAFHRWEEEQADYPAVPMATAWWWGLWCFYSRLHPELPSLDPEKYAHLAQVRRAL